MKYPRAVVKGEKVKVYRNLATGKISVIGVNEKGYNSVIAHVENIALLNPKFVVSEKGRARVLREKQKNVHAYVTGTVLLINTTKNFELPYKITYNPYKYSSFVRVESEEPVFNLTTALIEANGTISTSYL